MARLCKFVTCLHNLVIAGDESSLRWRRISNPKTQYNVISLNYDCVLETVCDFLNQQCHGEYRLRFQRAESDTSVTEFGLLWLVKLHGSVDSPDDIVPPTWSKTVNESIREQWIVAQRLLAEATHIRVLGYSLPTSDAYVRYLLKSSLIRAEFESFGPLKSFDVITLDSDGETKRRYDDFVRFKNYRFVNTKIESYLSSVPGDVRFLADEEVMRAMESPGEAATMGGFLNGGIKGTMETVEFDLEGAHRAFMKEARRTA